MRIPSELSQATELHVLDVSGNRFVALCSLLPWWQSALSAVSKMFAQWEKTALISSHMVSQLCTWWPTVIFWLYFLCCILSFSFFPSLLQESLLLSSRKRPTPRLQMVFLNHFVQASSSDHLFFFLSFQAAKPADLPDNTTSQGLVAVGEPVTASPYFSDWCGSRDGRESAHLCAAASTAQRWQQW